MNTEIVTPSPLLTASGKLRQVGWARQPRLDCNLENVSFYRMRALQRFRIKRWDYYGVTTPTCFFSITLADLGYAAQVFVYMVDFAKKQHHEEALTIPWGRGVEMPRNSTEGDVSFDNGRVQVAFKHQKDGRHLSVVWPDFGGQLLSATIELAEPAGHESTVMVTPIGDKRFFYNRKINCMPARGDIQIGEQRIHLNPDNCSGNLDWGRGVWAYDSFWVWASASGFLADGRTVGLNMGFGFGDTSAATENTLLLGGRIHKLAEIEFSYDNQNFMSPWSMTSPDGRVQLQFTPFYERVAKANLFVIKSEVHQMFGRYHGTVIADDGEVITIENLVGWAEEHQAKW